MMKYLFGLCLALLWAVPAVRAQISYPDLFDSQFDTRQEESITQLTLLQPQPDALPAPGIAWDTLDELTVHTNKGREGLLEDLHANGSAFTVRLRLGDSPDAPRLVLRRQSLETGGVDNDGGNAFHFRGHFRRPEGRLLWPLPHQGLASVGYRQTDYDVDGTTLLYQNIFTIFPATPPFHYAGRENLALAGLRLPVSSRWSVEALAGYKEEPSRLNFSQSDIPTQLTLPFDDAGTTAFFAVRRLLPDQAALRAYVGGETLRGSESVEREDGRSIGEADTTHRERSGGFGWQRPFGGSRRLDLFWETDSERWETNGFVPDPGQLQTHYALTSDLQYAARYALTKHIVGANWNQTYLHHQELAGTLQFLTLTLNAEADYAVRYFGLGRSGQTSYNQNGLRAILLRGDYTFPWDRFRIGLEASQLVPLGTKNSASAPLASLTPTDSNPRTTIGGWALNVRVERLF